ncbi:MAG: transcriptional regulator PpsR, partial [Myxococcales bacterium]|nr:transcriptional regulator PpsR [Myxococcales bacterium]
MAAAVPRNLTGQFVASERSIGALSSEVASRLITAAADIALVLDPDGVILDLAFGQSAVEYDTASFRAEDWIGRPWVDTVAHDSRAKVEQLLEEAAKQPVARMREVNQRWTDGTGLPFRYAAVPVGESGRILALGRDLRAIAALQQQLVRSQQSMEREYARLRHAETRYRLLFHIASEAVLIIDSTNLKIAEANPSAAELLEEPVRRIVGQAASSLFAPNSWNEVQDLLSTVRVTGWSDEKRARIRKDDTAVSLSVSLFRQDSGSLFLMRLVKLQGSGEPAVGRPTNQLLEVVEGLPDGFVVIDGSQRILTVNAAFLELAQLATEQQVLRESLDRWLGRPGVDLNILMANLREHGVVRNFATIIQGQYGLVEEVEVSGAAAAT